MERRGRGHQLERRLERAPPSTLLVVLKLISMGLLAGAAASYFMARAIQSLLFQTESHDLVTFATVPLVLATIAIIARALPAYRASRVEPLGALRAD